MRVRTADDFHERHLWLHVRLDLDQVEHVLSEDLVAQLEDQLRHGAEP